MAAVSARRMRGPSETGTTAGRARIGARSSGANPPSGPIRTRGATRRRSALRASATRRRPRRRTSGGDRAATPSAIGPASSGLDDLGDVQPSRSVRPPRRRSRLSAIDVGPLGVGALGDREPDAPGAELGRLLDDRLQPRPLDQGDDELEVGGRWSAPASRPSASSCATACRPTATRARHSPSRPLKSSELVAGRQAHHVAQVVRLSRGASATRAPAVRSSVTIEADQVGLSFGGSPSGDAAYGGAMAKDKDYKTSCATCRSASCATSNGRSTRAPRRW